MESISILIIEDEPMIARNLQQMLSAKGYSIAGIAYDKVEGLDKLAQGRADLVLLDINLGGHFEGLDIAEVIHRNYNVPFIFITSYADEQTLERAKLAHPSGYIVKPFEERDIYAALKVAWFNFDQKGKRSTSFEKVNEGLDHPLTKKEYAIVEDLISGKTYNDIAKGHFISINTVNTHIKNIYSKMGVHSRAEVMNKVFS